MSLDAHVAQILGPLACVLTFLFKRQDAFAASACLWWLGENLLDIAPYIGDARAGTLPLLGGNFGQSTPYGFHDWEFILGETGLLSSDKIIAQFTSVAGCLIIMTSLLWGGLILLQLYRRYQSRDESWDHIPG